jgi:Ras-related C3 botulinum toxin substrate 1
MAETTTLKLVMVGDGTVGKTYILYSYLPHHAATSTESPPIMFPPSSPIPSPLRSGWKDGESKHMVHSFLHRDTSGHEHYERLRFLAYVKADIFFIIFSISEMSTFTNAVKKVKSQKDAVV